ncbi:hypothetical protein GOP47_0024122 [Adiantum capillus-veneris]|uniref:Cyclic phosphodiesterase n=1 Tax=Adiantum capillus-veneris TaxID=13818 RepID=A0A9D4U445_ADICA|nr:hypothetical protein GOP47_0023515 [Adiantum capillus-veneris]KAI5061617.1 hypothetical protein GOP47_0024122 [Adiantum capillus-veneris]
MEGKGDELGWCSVWAQPSSVEEPPGLRPAMLHLRTLFQAPAFEPHVTVLGVGTQKLSLEQASLSLRAACRSLPPFTCRLTRPSCGNTFYQCVYMLVDPSHEVLQANKLVQGVFETQQSNQVYMPHMSLLYADLTADDKEKARLLVEENYGSQLCETEFLVSSLSLYSTDINDKALTSWKKVAEFPLEG